MKSTQRWRRNIEWVSLLHSVLGLATNTPEGVRDTHGTVVPHVSTSRYFQRKSSTSVVLGADLKQMARVTHGSQILFDQCARILRLRPSYSDML